MLLLDLDDLKSINDRFGHLTRNRALNRLARVMKEHCRATEIAARYGGDEFAILLLEADGERAQNVAGASEVVCASRPTSACTKAKNREISGEDKLDQNEPSLRGPDPIPLLRLCTGSARV